MEHSLPQVSLPRICTFSAFASFEAQNREVYLALTSTTYNHAIPPLCVVKEPLNLVR